MRVRFTGPASGVVKAVVVAMAALSAAPAIAALVVMPVAGLSFGSLVPGFGSGTVTLSAQGIRSASGAILFNQGTGAAGYRAEFSITGGVPGAVCAIGLPAEGAVVLAGPGQAVMSLQDIESLPASTITLNGAGEGTFYVGGTLVVSGSQAAGSYADSGGLTVSISCV